MSLTAASPALAARKIGSIVGLVVLILAAMVALGPLLWTLSTSLRSPAEAFTNPPQWLPLRPDFSNYAAVFDQVPMARFFLNSVIVTALIVVGQTITCTLSGYAFAVIRFPGRTAIFVVFLATMMVPLQTIIIPVFIIIRTLGLSDTLASLVIPVLGSAFGTFLMRQYFLQMPRELGEAARVDGATQFQVFSKVYAPMAAPAVATFGDPQLLRLLGRVLPAADLPPDAGQLHPPARSGGPEGEPGHRKHLGGSGRRRAVDDPQRRALHLRAAILHCGHHRRRVSIAVASADISLLLRRTR